MSVFTHALTFEKYRSASLEKLQNLEIQLKPEAEVDLGCQFTKNFSLIKRFVRKKIIPEWLKILYFALTLRKQNKALRLGSQ